LVTIFLIFAFAGVEPIATYKNNTLDFFSSSYEQISEFLKKSNNTTTQSINTSADIKTNSTTKTTTITSTKISDTTITSIKTFSTTSILTTIVTSTGIDFKTGIYKNYYLGLIYTPTVIGGGNTCYDDEFLILINNKEAKNPTYSELLNFLRLDNTDEYPYHYVISLGGFYFGTAESNVNLIRIKNIIDGIETPDDPNICADFAERLHNNAEIAGIRCGYVIIDSINHSLNVFETTDKGIVFIDDTGITSFGPSNCDKIVDVEIGKQYIPISLFPESGWSSTWDSLGIVTDIFITWDGEWN
jgi:hypothetical protein